MAALAVVLVAGGGQQATPALGAASPSPPEVTCAACILVDDTGRVLFRRAVDAERPNASTTKMVTALVTVGEARVDEVVTVSSRAAATGGGGLDLQAGDRYTVEALLYALLLSSSNDSAVALAEHVAGSEGAFVEEMNAVARELGADDTRFVNAHGLDAPGHHSSARDLARIAQALLRRPLLADIVAASAARVEGPHGTIAVDNRNVLLESYPGAVGVKTGYTAGAGDTLVAAARRSHRLLIAVAMGSASAATDSAALLDYGWERLERSVLVPAAAPVGELVFASGSTPVLAASPLRGSEHPARVAIRFVPEEGLGLPLEDGERVGMVVVESGDRQIASTVAVAGDDVGSSNESWAEVAVAAVIGSVAGALEAVGAL